MVNRMVVGVAVGLATWSAATLSVAGAGAATTPTLTATASFGQATYASGQTVSVKLSVHNSGTSAASGITAESDFGGAELVVDGHGFGSLDRGATIPAGGTVTVTVSGHLSAPGATTVTFTGDVFDQDGDGVAHFAATAPVTVRTTTVHGQVFGDANANGRADAHEGVSGVKLHFDYDYGNTVYSTTTTGGGRFSVVLPRAAYYLSGGHKSWTVIPHAITLTTPSRAMTLRAVHPLGKVLKATAHFTRASYRPGARAHVVITLRNTGSVRLHGITADCDRAGDPTELVNVGSGWGALAEHRSGVTIPAHGSRTVHVTAKVPSAAQRSGQVFVACDFGYWNVDRGYRPVAHDTARVPGQYGTLAGDVEYHVHGSSGPMTGLKNVRVVLADRTRCPVYKRSVTTDAKGHFRISHVPAGASYQLYVLAPRGWKVRGTNPSNAFVLGRSTTTYFVQVRRGSGHRPTVPTSCN